MRINFDSDYMRAFAGVTGVPVLPGAHSVRETLRADVPTDVSAMMPATERPVAAALSEPCTATGWAVIQFMVERMAAVTGTIGASWAVAAAGDAVVAFVLPAGPHGGAYAEQIVVPAASAVPAPSNADFAAASTLLLNGVAAQLAIDALDLRPGQTLAVTGAAGALGGYAVELAKAAGLRVVADAAFADEGLVRSLGADFVVGRGIKVAAQFTHNTAPGRP